MISMGHYHLSTRCDGSTFFAVGVLPFGTSWLKKFELSVLTRSILCVYILFLPNRYYSIFVIYRQINSFISIYVRLFACNSNHLRFIYTRLLLNTCIHAQLHSLPFELQHAYHKYVHSRLLLESTTDNLIIASSLEIVGSIRKIFAWFSIWNWARIPTRRSRNNNKN